MSAVAADEFSTEIVPATGALPPHVASNVSCDVEIVGPAPIALPDKGSGDGSGWQSGVDESTLIDREPVVGPAWKGVNANESVATVGAPAIAGAAIVKLAGNGENAVGGAAVASKPASIA